MEIDQSILEIFFPEGTLKWFKIIKAKTDEDNAYITLEEKNIPPITKGLENKKIKAVKFHDITITDFPLRGKRTLLTFRRRYWKIKGVKGYLKRDIKLAFPGTQLEQEFAAFLKKKMAEEKAVSLTSIAESQKIPTREFEKQYKDHCLNACLVDNLFCYRLSNSFCSLFIILMMKFDHITQNLMPCFLIFNTKS